MYLKIVVSDTVSGDYGILGVERVNCCILATYSTFGVRTRVLIKVKPKQNLTLGNGKENGEAEIIMRIYVSRDLRFRIKSGIRVSSKRWGKKNEINLPLVDGPER
jgi:hypothetical protein